MKKTFAARVLAAAMATTMAVPGGSFAIPGMSVVVQAQGKGAVQVQEAASLKTAPRVSGASGTQASSWSPATVDIKGISRYDDMTSTWLSSITKVTVNGTEYTRADYDSLDVKDTNKYACSYSGMNFTANGFLDGENTIVFEADGYKTKELTITKGKDETGTVYTLTTQKDGGSVVNPDDLDKSTLENVLIDAKALVKGENTEEKWSALQAAIATAQAALDSATTEEDISNAVSALQTAMKDFNKSTKGPKVEKIYYNGYSNCLEIAALGKTYSDDDYIDHINKVTVNGTEYDHAPYDAFDDDVTTAAKQYVFSYGAMQIGNSALKDGENKIEIESDGYDKKTINFKRNGDEYTFLSQTDGDAQEGIQNPVEDGEYTVTYSTKSEGSDEESMIGNAFDKKAKVVVKNGKMQISFLNTALRSFLLDFSVSDKNGTFKEATRADYGETNASGEYESQEFTMSIDDLTVAHKAAALVTAMGGQSSDIHNWDKYMKADLTFTSLTKGWEGYQKEIDDSGKLTGKELTEKVLVDAGYDTDGDGKISTEELQSISGELSLANMGLTDVSILKDLSDKVTTLDLSGNDIRELPEGLLDNMTGLVNFYIENNRVSKLPENFFKNNKQLDWISLAGNQLKEVKKGQFSNLSELTILDLSSNAITEVEADSFEGLTKLNDLGLMDNELTDLPDGLFKPMADSLEYFSISGNYLKEIPEAVMDAAKLKSFSAFANEIEDISNISFAKLPRLETLNLQYNAISKIGEKAFASNKNLNSLDLYDNCLTDFRTDALPAGKVLQKVDIRLNNIKVVNPEIRNHAQSYNKFYPQKTACNLTVSADGTKGIKWKQDLSTLDLIFWLDQTLSDRTNELNSVEEYKQMLADKGWDQKDLTEILDENGYDWDIYTEVQKKNADGTYETVWEDEMSDKAEATDGTFATKEKGTYRVVKTLYTTFNSMKQYRMTLYSNEYEYGKTTPAPAIKVSVPTSVKAASAAYNKVKISWKKVSGATGYQVYQYDAKTKKYVRKATVKGTSYTKGNLTTGTKYSFKVRAYKTVNGKTTYSGYSKVVSATPTLSKALKPTAQNTTKGVVKVSWKKVSGATGYQIVRSTKQNGTYKSIYKSKNANTLSYSNKGLKKGSKYYYKVRAYKKVGTKTVYGSYSTAVSVKVTK